MGKWVPDPKKAASDRVSKLTAKEKADRARRANPRSRADQKVRQGGRA